MCIVEVRAEAGEFLRIMLFGRSHLGATDYWDGNWLNASVEVKAGGFHGSVRGNLRAEELVQFHGQLARLQETLRGIAEFTTMEEWLSLLIKGDGRGRFEVKCIIRDQPGIGNILDCTFLTDQTFTGESVAQLVAAIQAFPILGDPVQG